jgi:acyl CoA:acetate/3-ketoacid CoA transferase beta subunit
MSAHVVTLPAHRAGVVNRVITNLAVVDVTGDGLVLRELAPGVTVDEVLARTAATLTVSLTGS